MTSEQQKALAATIFTQLGGRRFGAMVGASNLACGEFTSEHAEGKHFGLSFKFKMFRKAPYCVIVLLPSDTYEMRFVNNKGDTVNSTAGLYCDMLENHFSEFTGLSTRL